MRQARSSLDPHQREVHAQALALRLRRHPLLLRSKRIGFYIPVQGEMNPWPLVDALVKLRKDVFLPVLLPFNCNRLWFAPCTPEVEMAPNRFGIPEPVVHPRSMLRPIALDVVLTPLVAFDANANRLGMGGGYYDRTFAFLRRRGCWNRPHLIGLAYEFQRTSKLTPSPWDVPLAMVATESSLYIRKR